MEWETLQNAESPPEPQLSHGKLQNHLGDTTIFKNTVENEDKTVGTTSLQAHCYQTYPDDQSVIITLKTDMNREQH